MRQIAAIAFIAWLGTGHPHGQGKGAAPLSVDVQVYKQPGCGCCELWARHMRAAGFRVTVTEASDVDAMKRRNGIPANLRSCHTSVVSGYRVEGHVPIDVVRRMLTEKPAVSGIAVPGMPIGSPGMESGGRGEPYDVVAFDAEGRQRVYASVNR
jgi:hypothetical protein